MTTPLLLNNPILHKSAIKTHSNPDMTDSNEEYFTPPTSNRTTQASTDSETILTDDSSSEDTDSEDFVDISKSKPDVRLKLENDEAEFFVHIPSTKSPIRKRDRIRLAFRKEFSRSKDSLSDTNSVEWNEIFAKTLISMQDDIQEILQGFDRIEQQPSPDDSISNTSGIILTEPRLSFRERQLEKLEMMRIAQMLHPPNLLTYDVKEPSYPYMDIIVPHNINLLRVKNYVPDKDLLIQHKPFRHKKFRYRAQRGLLRIKRYLKKIRRDIYGENPSKSAIEASSLRVLNYQLRLQKTLLEFRQQIAEYDRIHAAINDHGQSISQIIVNMNSKTNSQIEDYRMKSRPMESAHKNSKNELISAPYIPPQAPTRPIPSKKDLPIDTRFDPTTFLDLNEEAKEYFGEDLPFWDKPVEARLSFVLPLERKQSIHFNFPCKTSIRDRFIIAFKTKQKRMRNQRRTSDNEYFDCISSSYNRRESQSFTSVEF